MLWKWILCLSFLIVVTSEEVELSKEIEEVKAPKGIEDAINQILRKFSETHGHKFKEFAKIMKNKPKAQEAVINDYVDDLLQELNAFIILQGLDPIEMPEIKEEFKWKVLLITYKGLMHLTDGWLQGLGTMDRFSDIKVTYQYPNVKIHLPMRYNVLMFDYKYKAKFMNVGPSGHVDGKTTNCRFTVDIDINMITLMAKLNKFNLNSIGSVSLKFSGNILTDWMTNVFVSVTIPFVKPVLNLIIQSVITGGLQTIFTVYNDFVCNLLGHCLL